MLCLWLLTPVDINAQDEPVLKTVSRTYAITNAAIIQAPGRKIDKGTIIIRNGLVHDVGRSVAIPPDAIVINAERLYVYPGFINGLSHIGIEKPREDQHRERPKDPGNPLPEKAGITPQRRVIDFIAPDESSVDAWRRIGFTAAHVVPYGKMLPGNGAVVLLAGESPESMIIRDKLSLYAELTPADRVYPSTTMGVIAQWRGLYRKAALARQYQSLYAEDPRGLGRPIRDEVLEAFYPVISRQQPVFYKAEKLLALQRVMTLRQELGFSLMLGEVKEGWDLVDKMKTADARVFISLDLPPENKKDDNGDTTRSADPETEALRKRRDDFVARHVGLAAAYQKAGLRFGFSGTDVKTGDVRKNLRRMISAGLTEDQALAALTTYPAESFGLSDRLGTIDKGKIASVLICDKPYFDEQSVIRYVFVEGVIFKIDGKEPPKADPNATAAAEGQWSLLIRTPQGKLDAVLTLVREGDQLTGSISAAQTPQAVRIENVTLEGTTLKFSYPGMLDQRTGKIEINVKVAGDNFTGSAFLGTDSFPAEGKKIPKF
ncbi:MAG TPA: amidohydrolase family protein [Ohtaekwangia sp.]|nr:amidohydrolase family protein [Ohtaekwangia sp.]